MVYLHHGMLLRSLEVIPQCIPSLNWGTIHDLRRVRCLLRPRLEFHPDKFTAHGCKWFLTLPFMKCWNWNETGPLFSAWSATGWPQSLEKRAATAWLLHSWDWCSWDFQGCASPMPWSSSASETTSQTPLACQTPVENTANKKRNSLSLHHFLISTFDVLRSDICYQDFAPKTSESASPWAQDRHSLDIFGSNLTISCRYERIKTPTAVIIVMAVPGFGLMDSTATSIGRPSWITDQHQSGSAFWGFLKWWYPQIIYFNRVFHYKPSILGYHYFRKHPFWHCSSTMIVNDGKP